MKPSIYSKQTLVVVLSTLSTLSNDTQKSERAEEEIRKSNDLLRVYFTASLQPSNTTLKIQFRFTSAQPAPKLLKLPIKLDRVYVARFQNSNLSS